MTKKYLISNIQFQISNKVRSTVFANSKFKVEKGFTLIELLIYTGMLSVILAAFTTLFGMIVDAQLELEATSSVQQDNQYILTKLSRDISSSQSITTPASLGQSSTSLGLMINSVAYTYSLDVNGDLQVATVSGSEKLNSYRSSIANLHFTKIGNVGGKSTVEYTYTVTSKTRQKTGYETVLSTSSASLR